MLDKDIKKKIGQYYILKFAIAELLPLMSDPDANDELEAMLSGKGIDSVKSKNNDVLREFFPETSAESADVEKVKTLLKEKMTDNKSIENVFENPFFIFGNTVYQLSKQAPKKGNNAKIAIESQDYFLLPVHGKDLLLKRYKSMLEQNLENEAIDEFNAQTELAKSIKSISSEIEAKLETGIEFNDFGIMYDKKTSGFFAYLKVQPFIVWNNAMKKTEPSWSDNPGIITAKPEYEFSKYSACKIAVQLTCRPDNKIEISEPVIIEPYILHFLQNESDKRGFNKLCMGRYSYDKFDGKPASVKAALLLTDARNVIYYGFTEGANPYRFIGMYYDDRVNAKEICISLEEAKKTGLPVTNITDEQAKKWDVRNRH